MSKRYYYRSFPGIIALAILLVNPAAGQSAGNAKNMQSTDSLSLKYIIERVVSTYPTVKVAEEAINNADARIGLARTGYNPELDVTAAYSNLGPVSKISLPDMGTFQLYPQNNYSAALNVRQVVYDFARTKKNVSLESENKAISEQALEQVKQRLSSLAVANFYTLAFLQAAIRIKLEELDALREHLSYVEKKVATGSSTEYEVLTTRVRISAVESQEVDLNAALTNQQAVLNSLLGNDQSATPVVKTELMVDMPLIQTDSILSFALRNRDEMLINKRRTTAAELRYEIAGVQNKPMLNFIATGGAKNGYIPDLYKITPNYVVGIGLRIPIYDGSKTKYNLLQAKSAITSISYETEYTRRNISTELSEAETYMYSAGKKVSQYELQLDQALRAYSLAETSFRSGSITNLDLLDSNTSVSESRLLLLKARIDYAASVYKLRAAMGERLY
jgi:outer membrane protein TolC